jgi:hypothetical protein
MMLIAIKPLKRKQKQNILHSAAASEKRQGKASLPFLVKG